MAAAATLYVERLGWSVIPINQGSKTPLVPWKRFTEARPTSGEMDTWARKWPEANVAVVTGRVSKLLVVDADGEKGVAELKKLGLPSTPTVRTPRGGLHAYFACPDEAYANASKRGESRSIDIRAEHGYVLAPHSRRPDGKRYEWITPVTQKLASIPKWLVGLLRRERPTPPVHDCVGLQDMAAKSNLLTRIPARLRALIEDDPLEKGLRSERDMIVVVGLLREGFTSQEIVSVYEAFPIGEKFHESGPGYLARTIASARGSFRPVRVKYADLNEYAGGGARLQLCLVHESEGWEGRIQRTGLTVPISPRSEVMARWQHFFDAVGVSPPPTSKEIGAAAPRLIGKRLYVRVKARGCFESPAVWFESRYRDE